MPFEKKKKKRKKKKRNYEYETVFWMVNFSVKFEKKKKKKGRVLYPFNEKGGKSFLFGVAFLASIPTYIR